MEPEPKKRKIYKPPPRRTVSSASEAPEDANPTRSLTIPGVLTSGISITIQQAKNSAVAQAQEDGCTGNFKKFDSQYRNFLIPVVPSRAELTG